MIAAWTGSDSILGRTNIQSQDFCGIMQMIVASDSKKVYEEDFCAFFELAELLWDQGLPQSYIGPCIHPMDITMPQDLALIWKALDMGGAAKVKKEFCYLCPYKSSNILEKIVGENQCKQCWKNNHLHCQHFEVRDKETVEKFQAELLSTYNNTLEKLKVVRVLSTISYDPTQENKTEDPTCINFIAPPSGPHCNGFAVFVVMEMEICNQK